MKDVEKVEVSTGVSNNSALDDAPADNLKSVLKINGTAPPKNGKLPNGHLPEGNENDPTEADSSVDTSNTSTNLLLSSDDDDDKEEIVREATPTTAPVLEVASPATVTASRPRAQPENEDASNASTNLLLLSDDDDKEEIVRKATPATAPVLEVVSPATVTASRRRARPEKEDPPCENAPCADSEGTVPPDSTAHSSSTDSLTTDINVKSDSNAKVCVDVDVSSPIQDVGCSVKSEVEIVGKLTEELESSDEKMDTSGDCLDISAKDSEPMDCDDEIQKDSGESHEEETEELAAIQNLNDVEEAPSLANDLKLGVEKSDNEDSVELVKESVESDESRKENEIEAPDSTIDEKNEIKETEIVDLIEKEGDEKKKNAVQETSDDASSDEEKVCEETKSRPTGGENDVTELDTSLDDKEMGDKVVELSVETDVAAVTSSKQTEDEHVGNESERIDAPSENVKSTVVADEPKETESIESTPKLEVDSTTDISKVDFTMDTSKEVQMLDSDSSAVPQVDIALDKPQSAKSNGTELNTEESETNSKLDEPEMVDLEDDEVLDSDTKALNDEDDVASKNEVVVTPGKSTANDYTEQIRDILKTSMAQGSDKVAKINANEDVTKAGSKFKRSAEPIDDVARKRSKLTNKITEDSANISDNDENNENVATKTSQKRASEKSSFIEVKKVRLLNAKEDAEKDKSDDKPATNGSEAVKSAGKQKLSNLDKAIERVAAGGLNNKREREICEFLRLLDNKSLESITTTDLEEMVCYKLCEVVTERSEVGHMRETIASLTTSVEKWRSSTRQMTKQIKDLELVFKRLVADSKSNPQSAVPIKITRSVGLQVGQPNGMPTLSPQKKTLAAGKSELNKVNQHRTNGIMTNRNTNPPASARPPPPPASNASATATRATATRATTTPPVPKAPLVVNRVVGPPPRSAVPLASRPANTLPANVTVTNRPAIRTVSPQTAQGPRLRMPVQVPPQVRLRPTPSANPIASDNLIDLTEEDDKKTSSPAPKVTSPARVLHTVNPPRSANPIRIVTQNQLTGNNASGFTTVPNSGPRLAYVVPNSGGGPAQPRSVFYATTSAQQAQGTRNLVPFARPASAQPQMLLLPSQNTAAARPRAQNNVRAVVQPYQQTVNRVRPLMQPAISPTRTVFRQVLQATPLMHPAPLPQLPHPYPSNPNWKLPPPQPDLKISKSDQRQKGIILSWKMDTYTEDQHEMIETYQLYAYQETSTLPSTNMWKKVGDVKSMPLPMACTLTQFSEGNKYHFAVRALDSRGRMGPFSIPGSILLTSGE